MSALAAPFPEPPQQRAPWAAPALDPRLVDAARRLFAQGVADPRGCPYRAITLVITEGWDDAAKPISTHGWVIPQTTFAIAWNGLVYPTTAIGAAADVAADVRAMLDAFARARAQARREDPASDFVMASLTEEAYYVAPETIAPGKALLLLRLGEPALAQRVWQAASAQGQPYEVLLDDWLWAQYARGVGAHHRGDVPLAIESWRRLPAFAQTPLARGAPAPYLADITALLADAQRRAARPAPPVDLAAIGKLPQPERVARLIAALDQVTATGFGGPDPITTALVREGEAALAPLLATYEADERRTRARFVDIKHGDSFRAREVIPVHEVAHAAIAQLVDLSLFQTTATDRGGTARDLRAYIQKWRGVSPLERQYRTLADDALDEPRWLIAATQLAAAGASAAPLRARAPSVTSLFERRLAGFADLRQRAQLLQAFAAWDAAAARPFLARTVREAFAGWATAPHQGMDPYLGEALSGLTTARIAAGDPAALGEYTAWLVTTAPEQAQFAAQRWFAPLLAHPAAPEVTRAAQALFSGASPWIPLTSRRAGFYMLELLGTDMIKLPAFRAHALAQLANPARLGTMRRVRGGLDVRTDAFQQGESVDAQDPRLPRDGWTDTLRVSDQYAASLVAGRTAAPPFRRYWPRAARDQAITAIIAWLKAQ